MTISAQAADGTVHEFPDETPDAVVDKAMKAYAAPGGRDLSLGEAVTGGIENIPHSAAEFGKAMAEPFLHPIETAKSLGKSVVGAQQQLGQAAEQFGQHNKVAKAIREGVPGLDVAASGLAAAGKATEAVAGEQTAYPKALEQMVKDRYGSWEKIKETLHDDPVGMMADISILMSGGETAALKYPALLKAAGATVVPGEKIAAGAAKVLGAAKGATDPLNIATKAVTKTGELGGKLVSEGLGARTGTSAETIRMAFTASQNSIRNWAGQRDWWNQFQREKNPLKIVDVARGAIDRLIKERGDVYNDAMNKLKANTKILDFQKIEDAVIDSLNIGTFKGQITNPSTAAVRQQIWAEIDKWRHLPAADFHTPAGLDALKKTIADLRNMPENRDALGHLTASGLVAEKIAKSITATIEKEAPEYKDIMRGYAEATDRLEEAQRELSLGNLSNAGMALRKMQSTLKNNVSTAYEHRRELAQYLVDNGAENLLEMISGAALAPWMSRGIIGRGADVAGTAGLLSGHPAAMALGAGMIAAGSPKLMGGAANLAGFVAAPFTEASRRLQPYKRGIGKAIRGEYQLGRRAQYLRQHPISGEDQSPISGVSPDDLPEINFAKPTSPQNPNTGLPPTDTLGIRG